MAKKISYFLISLFFILNLQVLAKSKTSFPKTINSLGKKLSLNGTGTRKASWFNVKVYEGALYLEERTSDIKKLTSSTKMKHIIMYFLRDVDRDKLVDGWKEAFNNRDNKKPIEKEIKKFLTLIGPIKKGEKIEITFLEDQIIFNFNGKSTTIKSKIFSHELFSVWFINPIDEDLMKGLLGI